jgi:hypothetical protein
MEAAIHHVQSVVAVASDNPSQNNGQLVKTLTIVTSELPAAEDNKAADTKIVSSVDLARLLECGDCV